MAQSCSAVEQQHSMTRATLPCSAKAQPDVQLSNMESFLTSASPSLPAFAMPSQKAVFGVRGIEQEPYFSLSDVWQSMNEWCAYGMEVPLRVAGCDVPEVVQCYVPYLSALQLRRPPTKHAPPTTTTAARAAASALIRFGHCGNDSDLDARSMTSSISDSMSCSEHGSPTTDSDCDDGHRGCTPRWRPPAGSKVLFEYNETRPPHLREPLTECIASLAKEQCPELNTLRSCDLDPHSWFSIAWYPLYRLPATGRTIRDLNACFLTYHRLGNSPVHMASTTIPPSLATLSPAAAAALARRQAAVQQEGLGTAATVLAPFAMVPYKMGGRTWEDTYRSRKLQLQLLRAADELTAHSGMHHGDFAFFVSTLRGRR